MSNKIFNNKHKIYTRNLQIMKNNCLNKKMTKTLKYYMIKQKKC